MIHIKPNTCDYCGTCVSVCPEDCIELRENEIKILHPQCTDCNKCVWICPIEVFTFENTKLSAKQLQALGVS